MRVNLSKLLAVGMGLIASIGMASAQGPAPVPSPAPMPASYIANGPAAGGCSSCGSNGPTTSASTKHKICDVLFIGKGTIMDAGCACTSAQRTFLFGSCNQFYGQSKPCSHCGLFGNCHHPVGGTGPTASVPPCVYSSYMNR